MNYDNGGGGDINVQNHNHISPPQVENNRQQPSYTPPPNPGQRVQGTKQFSKPMKIQKKKFVMDAPDPTQSGLNKPKIENQDTYANYSAAPPQSSSNMLSRDISQSQMVRDTSEKRLVQLPSF